MSANFRDVTNGEVIEIPDGPQPQQERQVIVSHSKMDHCANCRDVGVLRVINKTQESLALCTCEWARRIPQSCGLPVINQAILAEFEAQACPLKWFLPDNERESVPRGNLTASLSGKLTEWNNRVEEAKTFWAARNNKPTSWWQE